MRKLAWGITVVSALAITGMSRPAEAECEFEFSVRETPVRARIEKILKDDDSLDDKLKEQVRTALKGFEAAQAASSASEAAAKESRDSIIKIKWPDEHEKSRTSILEILSTQEVKVINKSHDRVAVHLANPPASRLRLSFDNDDGSHREVEWDPAVSSELTKIIDLHKKDTKWRITVAMEPSTHTQSQGTVLLTVRFDEVSELSKTGALLTGRYVALLASAGSPFPPRVFHYSNGRHRSFASPA